MGDRELTYTEPTSELLEVLCINCNKMIDVDVLELHSRTCQSITKDVQQEEQLDELELHLKQLRNLEKALQQLQLKPEMIATDLRYVIKLLEKIQETEAFNPNEYGQSGLLHNILQSIIEIINNFNGSSTLLVVAERLKIVLTSILKTYRDREIAQKRNELANIKMQIEAEKEKIRKPPKLSSSCHLPLAEIAESEEPKCSPEKERRQAQAKGVIEVVHSEMSESDAGSSMFSANFSRMNSSSSSNSSSSILSFGNNLVRNSRADNLEVSQTEKQKERRRTFYSLCLQAKFGYSTDSLAQKVQTAGLWRRALRKQVPEKQWSAWIKEALDDAPRWVAKNKNPKRQVKYKK